VTPMPPYPPYRPGAPRPPFPHKRRALLGAAAGAVLLAALLIADGSSYAARGDLAWLPGGAVLAVLGAAYGAPSLVARRRKAANLGAVVVVNLLLGWTVIGWAVAMAMAVRDVPAGRR
jgi:hypothetical protein